jgi:alpha-maltose-1-phosphate synthase
MTVIVGHPAGTANNRALVGGLARAGILDAFFTMLALPDWLLEVRLLPPSLRAQLGRRVFDGVPWTRIHTSPLREIVRIASGRAGFRWPVEHEVGWASIDVIDRRLAEQIARYVGKGSPARIVYAYEDAALEAFRAARSNGLCSVYELPIADWRNMRRILSEEREYAPDWVETIDALRDSPAKLARKDEEIALADHVIIPCEFVRRGLAQEYGVQHKTHVIPYGAPTVSAIDPRERPSGEFLRVAYVGQLSQRKGIAYLFEAIRQVAPMVQLTLIGPKPARRCAALEHAIEPHTWVPPVPLAEVLRRLADHHVMVLPSLCEGFGLVILEAMAQGLPVITTTNTGGPDVIEDGGDGFIVPIRDPLAIADRLTWLYDDEPRRLAMGHAARRKAAEHSWARYQRRMVKLLSALVA